MNLGSIELILNRRSIRKFKRDDILNNDLKIILESANNAPMAIPYRSWKLLVVRDKNKIDILANLSNNQKWIKSSSILIFGLVINKKNLKYRIIDTSIALQNIVIVAELLGYGSCWVGSFDEKKMKDILTIPGDIDILAFIALGKNNYNPEKRQNKRLEEIVYLDDYLNPFNLGE